MIDRGEATTPRTDAICKQSLEQRKSFADRGDPDGIYCLAVLYAARYGDERYPDAERETYGINARVYIEKAKALGYRVESIERDIVGGDNISSTGSYFGSRDRDPSGARMGCQANIGISCAAQCGESGGSCYYQCLGGNAWQCQ